MDYKIAVDGIGESRFRDETGELRLIENKVKWLIFNAEDIQIVTGKDPTSILNEVKKLISEVKNNDKDKK